MARSATKTRGSVLIVGAVALAAVIVALLAVGAGPTFTAVSGKDSISIPASSLKRGELRFFSYRDDAGKAIRFILARDDAGRVGASFDACQQCARYGKGYTSSRGYMVCRFCGNRYKIDAVPSGTSCAPIRLKVRESGDTITVDTRELKRQRDLF
jgi:uncharacterized membrane protein